MQEFIKKALESSDATTELVKMLYQDGLQPGVRQVGKAIEYVIEFCVLPTLVLKFGSEIGKLVFQRNMDLVRKKMAQISEENIVGPPVEVGVEIMEHLTKVQDEGLANMFATLLANSCNAATQAEVHPRFVHVLRQISSDEAKLISQIQKDNRALIVFTSLTVIPMGSEEDIVGRHLFDLPYILDYKIQFPGAAELYYENLISLGILGGRPHGDYKRLPVSNIRTLLSNIEQIIHPSFQIDLLPYVKIMIDNASGSFDSAVSKVFETPKGSVKIRFDIYEEPLRITSFGQSLLHALRDVVEKN